MPTFIKGVLKLKSENKKDKLNYERVSMEIIRFETEDVMTTSGMVDPGNNPGINLPIDPFYP